jgi:hypothetical protein
VIRQDRSVKITHNAPRWQNCCIVRSQINWKLIPQKTKGERMKKIISQLCTASILLSSVNVTAFAATQDDIRNVLAQYSSSMERGESSIKSLTEASLALKSKKISSTELVNYITADMDKAEAAAYRANVLPSLALTDADNVDVLFKQAAANMGMGSNFRGCNAYTPGATTWITGVTAIVFLSMASESNRRAKSQQESVKQMRLEKTDMESDIKILIGEGVKPESFLIASIQKDINYLDEQMVQEQQKSEESKKNTQTQLIVGAAAGVVSAIGAATNCY